METSPDNKNPSISIILPAKNEAENLVNLLPRLLEAVKDAEIIVVNDGSNDNTLEVCNQYNITIVLF